MHGALGGPAVVAAQECARACVLDKRREACGEIVLTDCLMLDMRVLGGCMPRTVALSMSVSMSMSMHTMHVTLFGWRVERLFGMCLW